MAGATEVKLVFKLGAFDRSESILAMVIMIVSGARTSPSRQLGFLIEGSCTFVLNYTTRTAAIFIVALFASHHSFAQTSGADIFKTKCAMCHGEDGLGNTPVGKPMGVVS